MTRLILAAGVAALAITAPAASQPGDRGGKDRKAQVQKSERGNARAERGKRAEQRANRVKEARSQRANRGDKVREQRANRVDNVREQRASRVDKVREQRANRVDKVREQRADRIEKVREQRADRMNTVRDRVFDRRSAQIERVAERRGIRLEARELRGDRQLARLANRNVLQISDWKELAEHGIWLDGCPPGLLKDKRLEPCVPPGLAKDVVGKQLRVVSDRLELRDVPNRLRLIYPDTDDYYYRFGNGYLYQVDRTDNLIMSLLPLFGLGLTAGQQFPMMQQSNYYMPAGLQSFYPDSPYTTYRFANGYVYEIDPLTGMIEDVDPLLGFGHGYGQMMPATYSAYNVPYQYRPLYADTSDAFYRYAPGAIYQVDPTTSLITAVAALLTGGMTVGQPLPAGYGAYNVPYQYRTTYYDTPNDWYRYSNGYVYRVDPATQLVTAIVASALT